MFLKKLFFLFVPLAVCSQDSWIRINQLGYTPAGSKVAVWCTKGNQGISAWELVERSTGKIVMKGKAGRDFGAWGPFTRTSRLNFSAYKKPGTYYLRAGTAQSPDFRIGEDVYKGSADFCLRYMRQQRTGFNPYLNDSCHTHDGYVLYGEKAGIKDSSYADVTGGWHDASDYLQYSTTSANATSHLLMAYRDFPAVFGDEKQASGLDGSNGRPDVLDEARWGLDWLLKMHPQEDRMFNQIGDDRDHMGMRMPGQDTNYYGRGLERPVYFVSGEPQQRGKFMNVTTGTSSTAGKFATAFALGQAAFQNADPAYAGILFKKALSAYQYGKLKPGFTQTASVRSPYIYAEMNWTDDMELAAAQLYRLTHKPDYQAEAFAYAAIEKITPWLGADTAAHYQWYPFINPGHYELAKTLTGSARTTLTGYYKQGIEKVMAKARQNAFYRGIPFIWCSNNLTTSFAIQCYWYRELTGDQQFRELEQANFDWLFGCNPWGTSMVYGLPEWGDTPVDPHSAFTHIKNYPIDGGLVDGPVYGSIFNGLIGIQLKDADEYAEFQSRLAVYHDDYGDYSTNEPTMDGTASLIYLLAAKEAETGKNRKSVAVKKNFRYNQGALIRGDSSRKEIALVFTGHEFAEGGNYIDSLLTREKIRASFFFTGEFYRNPAFQRLVRKLNQQGHYLGAHSDCHLLYCDWVKRDSLLISRDQFNFDLADNYTAMAQLGIEVHKARWFLPPYEWYNDSIAAWTKALGFQLISYTPGTRSHADYTTDSAKNFQSSASILQSVLSYEKTKPAGLNGFLLLLHAGAGPHRTDKFFYRLPELIKYLKAKGYRFLTVDQLAG